MLSEALQEERGVVSPEAQAFPIGEARQHRCESFPALIRTKTSGPLKLVVERGVREVRVEQRLGDGQRKPGAVHSERHVSSVAESFQVHEFRIFGKPKPIRGLGMCDHTELDDLTGLGHAACLDGAEQAVQPTHGLLELGLVDHGPASTLATQHTGLVQMSNRFTDGVSAHFVTIHELRIGREPVVELPRIEPTPKLGFELGPQRQRTVAVEVVRAHRANCTRHPAQCNTLYGHLHAAHCYGRCVRAFQQTGQNGSRTVVVVGEGLLGTAVSDRLRLREHVSERWIRNDWTAPPEQLGADLHTLLSPVPSERIEIVWTAGRGGMQLEHLDTAAHERHFSRQIQALQEIGSQLNATLRFTHASSAGALGPPEPASDFATFDSPYAQQKRAEETAVLRHNPDARIMRVSSAYGAPAAGGRAGVVGLLVSNALLGRETKLFARLSTMRNYVFSSDVAEAMVRSLDEHGVGSHSLLAAQRSHGMTEVIAEVRKVVRRAVPVVYRPPANDHDMVFDPTAASPLLPQRSLAAGVRATYDQLLGG